MKRGGKNSWSAKQIFLLVFLLAVTFFNIYYVFFSLNTPVTGYGVSSTGFVALTVEGAPIINIYEPKNMTYNFSVGESLILNLSVDANVGIQSWWYDLYDFKHDFWLNDIAFSPNTTFNAFRWSNRIFVHALSLGNSESVKNVTFFVFVPNSPPVIYDVPSQIFICEAQQLVHDFYAVDDDEDDLRGAIFPENPFFVIPEFGVRENITRVNFQMVSGPLSKSSAGGLNGVYRNFSELISITDFNLLDSKNTVITVIEINNPPFIEDVGVKTIWNQGENSTFYEEVFSSDYEYSLGHGNLIYNLTIWNSSSQIVNLFGINQSGVINFTAANQTQIGVYDIQVCVEDTGLQNPYSLIQTYCNQTGGSMTVCDNFSLTVTNQNRAPTIVNYSPENLRFNASGADTIKFNISTYDPDGTKPDAYWYVDGVFKEKDEGSFFDEFDYIFGCEIFGVHNVTVNITDGLLNDSLSWMVSVGNVVCPSGSSPSGGGGGGGGGLSCFSKWGCDTWNLCQNAQTSLNVGLLSGEDYRDIESSCAEQEFGDEACGFQIRGCSDLSMCFLSSGKPAELQSCAYTENPSCEDGIKNCHDSGCEFLVDCGGSCNACPTCSDKIKNQGEEGIDCSGPCPWRCIPEVPLLKRSTTLYIFLIIALILIIIVIIRLIRVLKYNRETGR
ncbi:MAG: hypothetical protein AABW50_01440 [Nanoarchaeota archaeon]